MEEADKTGSGDAGRRMKRPAALFVFLLLFSFFSATAYAGTTTAPGCDDGMWDDMKSHADAMRVADAATTRAIRQPSSSMAATCFDLALGLSARLGGMFADIAGGLQAALDIPPLSAWASVIAEIDASALIKLGRATPAFFPPDVVPPPLASLINGTMMTIGAQLNADGKLKLYNPFAGLGFKFDATTDPPLLLPNSLISFLASAFQLDLSKNLLNFKYSIDYQLGVRATFALQCMINLMLPTFELLPRLDLSLPMIPNFMICGEAFGLVDVILALGIDVGPLFTLLATAFWIVEQINALVAFINHWLVVVNTIMAYIQAVVTDLNSLLNIMGAPEYSLAGIPWREFNLPLPSLAPGCLVSMAIWAGKNYEEGIHRVELIAADADGVVDDTVEAFDDAGRTIQGVTGGGPYGKAVPHTLNASASELPYFTYQDLVESVDHAMSMGAPTPITGLGTGLPFGTGEEVLGTGGSSPACGIGCFQESTATSWGGSAEAGTSGGASDGVTIGPLTINCSVNGSVDASVSAEACGEASVHGALMNLTNAQILLRASIDLELDLQAPGVSLLTTWQAPPALASGTSSCAVVAEMPGPAIPGCH